jgi:hypothetical protein
MFPLLLVVLSVSQCLFNKDTLNAIFNFGYQPILVPADIEHCATSDSISMAVGLSNFSNVLPFSLLCRIVPTFQGYFGIWISFPKLF